MDCNICLEGFNSTERTPIVVPCGHTLCLKCLRQLPSKRCPTCRQVFAGAPESYPSNFAVLQLLRDRKVRPDSTDRSRWCTRCAVVAVPRCLADHEDDVVALTEALDRLRRRLKTLPRYSPARLQEEMLDAVAKKEDVAANALSLMGGKSWSLTLRDSEQKRVFSGTLDNAEDTVAITTALLVVAAKADLKEEKKTKGKCIIDFKQDLIFTITPENRAANLDLIRGVDSLLNVCSNVMTLEALRTAAPTVERLSLDNPSPVVLASTFTMPQLTRLVVVSPAEYAKPLEEPPRALGRLLHLEVTNPKRAPLVYLLQAFRHSLQDLELHATTFPDYIMTCSQLFSVLKLADLRVTRRVTLRGIMSKLDKSHQVEHCKRQRASLQRALPAACEVLCPKCD